MEAFLPYYEIKCDEENNPSTAVDSGHIWVRVSDAKNYRYIDVIF